MVKKSPVNNGTELRHLISKTHIWLLTVIATQYEVQRPIVTIVTRDPVSIPCVGEGISYNLFSLQLVFTFQNEV